MTVATHRTPRFFLAGFPLTLAAALPLPPAAVAQDRDETAGQAAEADTIIVTGTRLARPAASSPSPVQVVTRDDLALTAVPNVEQTLNQLPQLVGGFTSTSNNPGTGAATLDLRGLGSVRTLVLVNGRRWIASDAGDVPEVDLNTIPAALVERIDIVTGGASAVYGSDAVTGVVNFVLRKDLEGLRLDARQSVTGRGDGRVSSTDASFGTGFLGGRGHVVGAVGWLDQASVLQGDRALSRVALTDGCGVPGTRAATGASVAVNDPACAAPNVPALVAGGSGAIPGSRILGRALFPVNGTDLLQPSPAGLRFDPDGTPRPFVAATDLYNYAPDNYLQVPFTRWSGNLLGSLDLAPAARPYVELSYIRTRSASQLAPVPAVLGGGATSVPTARINLANPLLTPAAARVLDLSYGVDARGRRGFVGTPATGLRVNPAYSGDADGIIVFPIVLQSRLDLGPRQRINRRDAERGLIGMKGDLGGGWSYDAFVSRSRVDHGTDLRNSGSAARLQQALLAVRDPATGIVRCLDPSGGCVPADIFGEGNLSPAAAEFIATNPVDRTVVEEGVEEISVAGELPLFAAKPAAVAAGATRRRTAYRFAPDASLFTGDDLGFEPGTPAAGRTRAWELFAETRVPLLRERHFPFDLTAEFGARWSHYNTVGGVWTWKALGEFAPVAAVRLRGGYQRAVRAPNVRELFEQQTLSSVAVNDPCDGDLGFVAQPAIAAACLRNGVPAETLGQELGSAPVLARQGNPALGAEVAGTWTAGAVLALGTPANLSASIDYYDVHIRRAIGAFGGNSAILLFGCILHDADPADPLCRAYRRAPDGSLLSIDMPNANFGSVVARGIDWRVSARIDLGLDGRGSRRAIELRSAGTRYLRNGFRVNGDVPSIDCVGRFGGACGETIAGTATPAWKLYSTLAWTGGRTELSLRHRWFSSTHDYREAFTREFGLIDPRLPAEGRTLEARHYFDLAAAVRLGASRVTLGVNNLFDTSPAVTGSFQVQANTDPSLYDVLGRRWYVALALSTR